jgi:hypothetical protein
VGGPWEAAALADCTASIRKKTRRFPDPTVVWSRAAQNEAVTKSGHALEADLSAPRQMYRPTWTLLFGCLGLSNFVAELLSLHLYFIPIDPKTCVPGIGTAVSSNALPSTSPKPMLAFPRISCEKIGARNRVA